MYVFAFDRDHTVDVSPHPERRTVPLAWVEHLARGTDHEVWAVGNQRLADEAGIPGIQELIRRRDGEWYEKIGERADEYHEEWPTRRERVRMLADLFPQAEAYVVVDDADLSDLAGWTHYFAWDFLDAVEAGRIDVDLPP